MSEQTTIEETIEGEVMTGRKWKMYRRKLRLLDLIHAEIAPRIDSNRKAREESLHVQGEAFNPFDLTPTEQLIIGNRHA